MNDLTILLLQVFLSTIVFAIIMMWYVAPWLSGKPIYEALILLILPHAFRHMGMSFLVSTVVKQPLPPFFASPAAYGDLAAGLLALLSIIALRLRWRLALPLVWVFNVVGSLDLVNAFVQGIRLNAISDLGATWFIPTLLVPALLVTHAMIFKWLLKQQSVSLDDMRD